MHFNGPSAHGFELRIDSPEWERSLREHRPRGGDNRRPWRPVLDPARVWLNADARPLGLPPDSMQSTFFVDRAIEFLKKQRSRPFALVVSFCEPHSPFHFPDGWAEAVPAPASSSAFPISEQDRRQQPEIFTPLTPDDVKGIQAAYFTSLSFVDSRIGRLIEAVDQMGLASRTLVVYVGDNGYMLGQHGRIREALLLRAGGSYSNDHALAGPHRKRPAASLNWWKWSTSCRPCSTCWACRFRQTCKGSTSCPCSRRSLVPRRMTSSSASTWKTKRQWCDPPVTS